MRLGVATICVGKDFTTAVAPATITKEAYCKKHGYSLSVVSEIESPARPLSWYKLPLIERMLSDYDWVWTTDADALVTNDNSCIDSIIEQHPDKDLILSNDCHADCNCGSFLIRNCPWSFELLSLWWNQTHHIGSEEPGDYWEQDAMVEMLQMNYLALDKHSVRIDQRMFNSFYKPFIELPAEAKWQQGDFICHVSGGTTRKASLGIYMRQAYMEAFGKPFEEH
jgi:hypothetical protein